MLASLSPARRRLVLAVGTLVAVAALVCVAAIVAATRPRAAARAVPADVLGPVLLVPGYGGSTTGLQTLATRLRAGGRTVDVVPMPGGGTGDLDQQAIALGQAVAAALTASGAPSVDLVGYSAGGIVVRLFVDDHGGAGLVRRVLTLGTPHHGTELAALGVSLAPSACPLACQQLAPGSELLAGLNGKALRPAGQFVSLWTTADDVVLPADSARLDGAVNLTVQSVCPSSQVRHSGLPTDPSVDGIIAAELAAGRPVTLGAADCTRLSRPVSS
jgi:triacylglycerol esterase/lipase EstA (alpha/beta hydrolase family)